MKNYIFYTKELYPEDLHDSVFNMIMQEAIDYYKYFYPDEANYVINKATELRTIIDKDYANQRIVARIVGKMDEKDYIMLKLKY